MTTLNINTQPSERCACAMPKRIAAIHDLSCFGRCALTVIIPVLSAMGHQTVPVPTALLSTHTGGFDNLFFLDLTEQMTHIYDHFKRLGLEFDAIYSGFLGNAGQVDIVKEIIHHQRANAAVRGTTQPLVFIDPVMGDDGVLYSTYNRELVEGMRVLCHEADIITPNITEAAFLTDTPCVDTTALTDDELYDYIDRLAEKLEHLCSGRIVITGIGRADGNILTVAFEAASDDVLYFEEKMIPASYPGTGDIFASVLLGKLLEGADFESSVKSACTFVSDVIGYSLPINTPHRDGVAVEALLKNLI